MNSSKRSYDDTKYAAPVEYVCEFLIAVKEKKYKDALELSNKILFHEPSNKLVIEYKEALEKLVQFDEESKEDDDEDDEGEYTDDSSDCDDDDDSDNSLSDACTTDDEIDYIIDKTDDFNIHK